MKKLIILIAVLLFASNSIYAGCLDGKTTTSSIVSTIRGFYINHHPTTGDPRHYVIIDKATCAATNGGDVTLASLTKSHYYLGFDDKDKTLFAMLLAADTRGLKLTFRLHTSQNAGSTNKIAYVLSPSNVNAQ